MASAARHTEADDVGERQTFGRWLLSQSGEPGLIGRLGAAAVSDRGFPKDGTPEKVHARLVEVQADGDLFAALEDAELAWPA